MNRIGIEDSEQLFSLFEQVITDFPEESEDEEEIVEDESKENELKNLQQFEGTSEIL